MSSKKKKKEPSIFEGIRKPTAPPSQRHETDKKKQNKKPKHKKPIEVDE